MTLSRSFARSVAAALALLCTEARADSSVEPIRLVLRAPSSCGDSSRFFARVGARTSRFRIAEPNEPSRVFLVDVTERDDGASGRLTIEAPGAQPTQRTISARSCQEVLDGLAFVTALAIDPQASTLPEESAPVNPPLARQSAAIGGSIVAGGYTMGAVAPSQLWGGRLGFELADTSKRFFSPAARIVAQRAGHPGFETPWGIAHVTYTGAALEACPVRIGLADPLALRPCLEGGIGWVNASGSEAPYPESSTRGWAEIGLEARLEWAIRATISVEVAGGYLVPLRRDRFLFGPNLFHEVGTAGAMATLGLNIRLF